MTDRSGRIVLHPGFANGLVILRLLAGNVEPMVELPIMPGESGPTSNRFRSIPSRRPSPWNPRSTRCATRSSTWWRFALGSRRA